MSRPNLIIAADWGSSPEKRWLARAVLDERGYTISHPVPVGVPEDFLARIRRLLPKDGTALVGFDFPIGLPAKFADQVFMGQGFREILGHLEDQFFTPINAPTPEQPFGPASSKKGACSPEELARRLSLKREELLRACDVCSRAHSMFHTLGARQVGRAAIHGWRHVLRPSLGEVSLWPFDGTLAALLERPGLVLAEIYPALYHGRSRGTGKETASARQGIWSEIWRTAHEGGAEIALTPSAEEWIEVGFASSDDFDAMAGVVGMIQALALGGRQEPLLDSAARRVEGWMLGLEAGTSATLDNLKPRPYLLSDPEDLVHLDWLGERRQD